MEQIKKAWNKIKRVNGIGSLLPLALLLVFFAVTTSTFWSTNNLMQILRQSAVYVIMGIGMTFVVLTGGIDLSGLKYIIREGGDGLPPLAIKYGMFLQSVIDFVIIAFSIFLFIKVLMKLKKEEKTDAAPAAPKEEVVLLSEIRDLLKK